MVDCWLRDSGRLSLVGPEPKKAVYANFGEKTKKFRTTRTTSETWDWTWHLPSTSFKDWTAQSLVEPTSFESRATRSLVEQNSTWKIINFIHFRCTIHERMQIHFSYLKINKSQTIHAWYLNSIIIFHTMHKIIHPAKLI